jgi:hypothetical protein
MLSIIEHLRSDMLYFKNTFLTVGLSNNAFRIFVGLFDRKLKISYSKERFTFILFLDQSKKLFVI